MEMPETQKGKALDEFNNFVNYNKSNRN